MPPASDERKANTETLQMILAAVGEVKGLISGLDERVRQLERATIEQNANASNKIDALFRKLDEHATRLRELESEVECRVKERVKAIEEHDRRIQEVEGVSKIAKWLGAAVMALIIGLVWGIMTHTVSIGVPVP